MAIAAAVNRLRGVGNLADVNSSAVMDVCAGEVFPHQREGSDGKRIYAVCVGRGG